MRFRPIRTAATPSGFLKGIPAERRSGCSWNRLIGRSISSETARIRTWAEVLVITFVPDVDASAVDAVN